MRNTGLEETQAGIKTAGRNINNLRYADDTTLMAEIEDVWISNTVEYDLERMLSEYCRAISSVHSWLGLPLWDSQVYSVLWLHPEEAALKDFSIAVLFIYSVVSVSCVQQSDSVLYKKYIYCCSVTKSCLTLCDSMDCSTPGFPVPHCLPEFAQVHVL